MRVRLQVRRRPRERVGEIVSALAPSAPHCLLGALDRVEGAETPDDHLVASLVERQAARVALRHALIVGAPDESRVSHWCSLSQIFGESGPLSLRRFPACPRTTSIGVTVGDFATTRVEGRFSLAYLVFNTINNLTTQDAQVACFENVAAHLEPGGCFVIEVGVPAGKPLRVFNLTGLAGGARPDGTPRPNYLRERWADWNRAPFTSESRKHVSVWEKPP
jgi:hypothetical protein